MTTERYLGCKQRFRNAVNDRLVVTDNLKLALCAAMRTAHKLRKVNALEKR